MYFHSLGCSVGLCWTKYYFCLETCIRIFLYMKALRQYNYYKQGKIYVYIKDLFKQLIVALSICCYRSNICTKLLMLTYYFAQSLSFCQACGFKCGSKNSSIILKLVKNCKFLPPSPNLLKQKLWEQGPEIYALISHPGDSDAPQGLRTTDLVQCFSTSALLTSQVVLVMEGCCCIVGCLRNLCPLDTKQQPPTTSKS